MAETNRVLNFSEFGKKYSQDAENNIAASYSEFSTSSDKFQDGFDEDTYEDGQAGPKRPIQIDSSETPDAPQGFNTTPSDDMDAPIDLEDGHIEYEEGEDEIEDEDIEDEEIEDEDIEDEDYGDPEGEDDEEEDEDDEEEETNESAKSYLVESFDTYVSKSQPRFDLDLHNEDFEDLDFEDDGKCVVICKSCGSEKEIESGHVPFGKNNEEDPQSWWQGAVMGMQCGCNM